MFLLNFRSHSGKPSQQLLAALDKRIEELYHRTTSRFDEHLKCELKKQEDKMDMMLESLKKVKDQGSLAYSDLKTFLHAVHVDTGPQIAVSSSINGEAAEEACRNARRCTIPVSVTRRSVSMVVSCGVFTSGWTRVRSLHDHVVNGVSGYLDWVWLQREGASISCARIGQQKREINCTISNLAERTKELSVIFTCRWVGKSTATTVNIKVLPALNVAIDFGTKSTKAAYVNEKGSISLLALGQNTDDWFLSSRTWLCDDRHTSGLHSPPAGSDHHCTFVDNLKVKIGQYCQLMRHDVLLKSSESRHGALEIEPACFPNPASKPDECQLAVVRRECVSPNGRERQQVDTVTLMGSFMKTVEHRSKEQLGGGAILFTYVMPYEFRKHQWQAFMDAVRIAGKKDSEILLYVPETVAGAFAFLNDDRINLLRYTELTVLVIDFGHGTTGLTLMYCSRNGFQILAGGGSPVLGGRQFNHELAEHINQQLRAKNSSVHISSEEAETIKLEVNSLKKKVFTVDGVQIDSKVLDFVCYRVFQLPLINHLNELLQTLSDDDSLDKPLRANFNIKAYLYANLREGKGLALTMGGTSYLKCLLPIIQKFFKQYEDPHWSVRIVEGHSLTDKVRFLSSLARGAALISARSTGYLADKDMPREGFAQTSFLAIRVKDFTEGQERCRKLVRSQAFFTEISLEQVNVTWQIKLRDNNPDLAFFDLNSLFCQSTDSVSPTTPCNRPQCHPIRLEKESLNVSSLYGGLVNISITPKITRNGTLLLNIAIYNPESGRLSRAKVVSSSVLRFNDGFLNASQKEVRKKLVNKMHEESSAYKSCSLFEPSETNEPSGRHICDGKAGLALGLGLTCCLSQECSKSLQHTRGADIDSLEKDVYTIPTGEAAYCNVIVSERHSRATKPHSNVAIIVDSVEQQLIVSFSRVLEAASLAWKDDEDSNVALMALVVGTDPEDDALSVFKTVLPPTEVRSLEWKTNLDDALAMLRSLRTGAELNMAKSLPQAIREVCKAFGRSNDQSSIFIVSSGVTDFANHLQESQHAIWKSGMSCLRLLEPSPNIWPLVLNPSQPAAEGGFKALLSFFGSSSKLITAEPVRQAERIEDVERQLSRLLRVTTGVFVRDIELSLSGSGSGSAKCTSEEQDGAGNDIDGYLLGKKLWSEDWLALTGDEISPASCVLASKNRSMDLQVNFTLSWRDPLVGSHTLEDSLMVNLHHQPELLDYSFGAGQKVAATAEVRS